MKNNDKALWFQEARFGMFIHWGLYAIPAKSEWYRSMEKVSNEDYQPYFEEFNPIDYRPQEWAKLCRKAGMKYAVLTAKHHDGFCLFDSKYTDYKATNTPANRDLVSEFLDAFRAEGIRVGLYYSLVDWHHPDYPAYGDEFHPMRGNEAFRNQTYNFESYLTYLHNQVRELCTNYGKLDLLWFDFSYGDKCGEGWHATELVSMVRSLQPDILINSRLEASGEMLGSLMTDHPTPYAGDFLTPEQIIPPEGLCKQNGNPVCWEACLTMNNSWGYRNGDLDFKTSAACIHKLVECVSKNGNLILNIGPDAKGKIPPQSVRILEETGNWIEKNGDSIYGCGEARLQKLDYRYTTKGNSIYLHITDQPVGPVPVPGIKRDQIKRIRLLSTGAELSLAAGWAAANYPKYTFISLGKQENETYAMPDSTDTVVRIDLK